MEGREISGEYKKPGGGENVGRECKVCCDLVVLELIEVSFIDHEIHGRLDEEMGSCLILQISRLNSNQDRFSNYTPDGE